MGRSKQEERDKMMRGNKFEKVKAKATAEAKAKAKLSESERKRERLGD